MKNADRDGHDWDAEAEALLAGIAEEVGAGADRIRSEVRRALVVAAVVFTVGLVLCIGGLSVSVWLSGVGFVLMVGATVRLWDQGRLMSRMMGGKMAMIAATLNPLPPRRK